MEFGPFLNVNKQPLVTVFTFVYNTHVYAIEALEAIKNQTFKNFQHIIIDDFSTDDSAKLVEDWVFANKWNCLFIKNIENKGVCYNLNIVLKKAKGKYMCGLSDDLWDFDHLEKQVSYFEKLPNNVAVIYSDYSTIDEQSVVLKESHVEFIGKFNDIESKMQFRELLKGNFVNAPTAIMRKEALEKVGGYDERFKAEDQQMWLNLTYNNYKLFFVPFKSTYYRIRRNSITQLSINKGIEDPLILYSKYLGINKDYDQIIAPRFYYWAKRLVRNNKDYRLFWPFKTFMLNKDLKSFVLLSYCLWKKLVK